MMEEIIAFDHFYSIIIEKVMRLPFCAPVMCSVRGAPSTNDGLTSQYSVRREAHASPLILVVGLKDPGYYERFGFRSPPDLAIDGIPQEYVLVLPFEESKTSCTVVFHDGFAVTG
ncbi:MAG: hypothetical protein JW999_07185 [Methanotrichaceae archaeon]|nr:hypothetical protein [Methanotrichaceae archaeon]